MPDGVVGKIPIASQRETHPLRSGWLSEAWRLGRETSTAGATVTLSPNPELILTGV